MSHRIQNIIGHFKGESNAQSVPSVTSHFTSANAYKVTDDDVVVVASVRTPTAKAGRGEFANLTVEDLLAPCLSALVEKTKIDPSIIGDIVVGSVLGSNVQRANEARMAQLIAGIPAEVPLHTVNRQCASGLQAIAECAAAISSGYYDVGIGAGVEIMSSHRPGWDGKINSKVFLNQQAKDCLLPMGITSENVARKYNITRKDQDELAVMSHQRAAKATASGRFDAEIIPITVQMTDKKTGKTKKVVVTKDGGIRASTTLEGLAKIRPAFDKKGTTTGGNASQVSDGASATLVMRRSLAKKLGLPILGTFISFNAVGVDPKLMGIGPVAAIPKALKLAGLTTSDIDLFEINEAFASQAVYSVRKLGLTMDNVNVNGGAIALGHALSATGSRMTATLLHELAKRHVSGKPQFGVVSMCIGSGMGAAAVFRTEA